VHGGPPRPAVIGSLSLHGALIVLGLFTADATRIPPMPQTVRVRMVAAAPEDAPVRVDPAPPEIAEVEHRPPPPDLTPVERPRTETPKVRAETPPPVEPEPEPARTEEIGEEPVNVQLEGSTFAFPDYLSNIIRQVNRYWRPPADGRALSAEVSFVIHRDGSVSDIEWIRRSGSPSFDLVARGAVEAAGRDRAFGPLPAAYPRDALRVSFFFDPTSR